MGNLHLFELINASPGLRPGQLLPAMLLARWLIDLIPLGLGVAWVLGDNGARDELLQIVLGAVIALALAQVVALVWPHPRPFAMHLGTQYLAHGDDPGLPSDHVTVFWSVALGALSSRRFALWGFPLLALGLAVGWSRVYLGVHFPLDIVAALPVAFAGVLLAQVLRRPLLPVATRLLYFYDRLAGQVRARLGRQHES